MIRPLLGGPYVDLERYVDVAALGELDDEVCAGLACVATDYTGGSHKSMGIVPPSSAHDRDVDYGQVIAAMSRADFARFIALSDTPYDFDLDRRTEYEFGEEREWPLSRRQMRFLEFRHRVYFPWKVFYELVPNWRWEDRARGEGKMFTDEARCFFPRTIAFIERLPFARIGRCNILGLQSHDHGTVHHDGEEESEVGHFITLCPRGDKRLFLWDEERRLPIPVHGRAYWFDDRNYHGIAADPFFRYSIRVDGAFQPEFLRRLRSEAHG